MAFRVVKQLYPNPQAGDPEWAARNVNVARLSGSGDQIWEFSGSEAESDASTKATELSGSDGTKRMYKIIEV